MTRAESHSLHRQECSWATKADTTSGCPVPTAAAATVLWEGPHGLQWGSTPHLHLLCHSPPSLSSRTGTEQHLQPRSLSAWQIHGSVGSKPTSVCFVLSQHLNPLLLRIKLLLYEQGAAHIHEAARGPIMLRTGHSLFWR